MSFANTTAHSEWSVNSGKTYVSTGNFAGAFYTYTASTNASLQRVGALTTVATAANGSTSLFGRNHHLVLNGRKLTPGVNPMNSITGAATATNNPFVYGSSPGAATVTLSASGAGANTQTSSSSTYAPKFMVGVADIQTGLNGFIDPTNPLFALYDKNRPVADYLVDMATGLSVANAAVTVNSGQSDRINTDSIVVGGAGASTGGSSTGQIRILGAGAQSLTVSSSIVTPSSIILLTPANVSSTVTIVASTVATSTTLTVASVTTGTILPGMVLPLSFAGNTLQILSQLTGTTGGAGTYLLSAGATNTVTPASNTSVTVALDNTATAANVSAVGTGTFTVNITGGSATLPSVVNFLIIN
jgi:hypothetical protein